MPTRLLPLLLLLAGACALPIPAAHAAALPSPLPLCGGPFSSHAGGFPRVLHVGTRPGGAAVSERTGHAFIPLSGTNGIAGNPSCRSAVTTIDVSTGRFLRSVAAGATPPALVVDDAVGRVFVAGYTERRPVTPTSLTIAALDLQGRVVRELRSVNPCPCAGNSMGLIRLSVDARKDRLFVFTYGSVLTFDARSLQLLMSVPIDSGGAGGGPGYAVDSRDGRVFVATERGVTVLSASTGAVVQTMTINLGVSERSIALVERTGRLFVGNGSACRGGAPGDVTVLDTATGAVVRTVLSSCFGYLSMLVDAPARRVLVQEYYVAQGNGNRYAVLDAGNGRLLRYLNLAFSLDYATVDERTGLIYAGADLCTAGPSCHSRNVQVLNPTGWRVVKTVDVGGHWRGFLTVAAKQQRLLVVDPYTGTATLATTA